MYVNKQNNIDIVYAILHSIQRSLYHHRDNIDYSINIKSKKNIEFQSFQFDHIVYHNK